MEENNLGWCSNFSVCIKIFVHSQNDSLASSVSAFILHIISNNILHQRKVKQKFHKNTIVSLENLI